MGPASRRLQGTWTYLHVVLLPFSAVVHVGKISPPIVVGDTPTFLSANLMIVVKLVVQQGTQDTVLMDSRVRGEGGVDMLAYPYSLLQSVFCKLKSFNDVLDTQTKLLV